MREHAVAITNLPGADRMLTHGGSVGAIQRPTDPYGRITDLAFRPAVAVSLVPYSEGDRISKRSLPSETLDPPRYRAPAGDRSGIPVQGAGGDLLGRADLLPHSVCRLTSK